MIMSLREALEYLLLNSIQPYTTKAFTAWNLFYFPFNRGYFTLSGSQEVSQLIKSKLVRDHDLTWWQNLEVGQIHSDWGFPLKRKQAIVTFDFFNSPFVVIEHGKVIAMGAGSKWVELAYFRKHRQLSEHHAVQHWGDTKRCSAVTYEFSFENQGNLRTLASHTMVFRVAPASARWW